jgi:hypothetical protein
MLARTAVKDAISKLYQQGQFSPSTWYKEQSPFTDGFSPSSTWSLPYNGLRDQLWDLKGNGLVWFQIEWVAVLVEDMQIDPDTLTFFSDHDRKSQFAKGLGVKVVTDLGELLAMRFNYMLKNAPYDKGIKVPMELPFYNIGPHSAFSVVADQVLEDNGICFDVLPCNWLCLPNAQGYRNWLLDNFEIINITIWDNSQKQVFDINLSDIVTMITRKKPGAKNDMVEWVSYGGQPFTVDLRRYGFWPMYKSPLSVPIFDAVMYSKINDIPVFDAVDLATGEQKPLPPNMLSANLARVGARQNPEPQKQFIKDALKNIKQPIFLGFSSAQEKDYHYEWMGTQHYAYLLSMVQSTPKNQPVLFSLLGEHGFNSNDFYSHFGVTPTQDQEVQQWYQSIR